MAGYIPTFPWQQLWNHISAIALCSWTLWEGINAAFLMTWVCVGGIIFCLHYKRASLVLFSLLTDKDELMSHKQYFLFGLFHSHCLFIWFIFPLRYRSHSFTKLWLQATACNFFNAFGWFQNCFIWLLIESSQCCELLWSGLNTAMLKVQQMQKREVFKNKSELSLGYNCL